MSSFLFPGIHAQQIETKEKANGAVEIVFDDVRNSSQHNILFRSKSMDVDDYWTVDPTMKWGHTQPWSNPQINFVPSGVFEAVGDLDGDGTTDFINTYQAWDERTEDLSDRVMKTLVFMGSGDLTNPDHIIYDALFPIGDIAGAGQSQLASQNDDGINLYQFSSGSFNTTSIEIPELESLDIPLSNFTIIRDDIDGNSTEDIIVNVGTTVHIGLIDTEIENSTVLSFDLAPEIELQFFSVRELNYVNWDGVPYLLTKGTNLIQGTGGTNYQQALLVFELDITNETVTLVQSSDFAYSFSSNMFLAEDSNGFPNILVTGTEFDTDTTGGDFMKLYTMSGDTSLYVETPVDLGAMDGFPIGDLNGNGWSDFVVNSNDEYSFATLNPADTTLTIEGVLGGPGGEDVGLSFDIRFTNQGDLNDDGFDDLQYYGTNSTSFGQLRIEGVASGGTVDYANPTEHLFDRADYRITGIEGTYTFGDISGNGLDDYGLIVSDGLTGRMDIYEGGSDGTTPTGTIELDGFVQFVTSGDFNTDGREDILMLIQIDAGTDEEPMTSNELHFYELGAEDPYHVIKSEDYQPGLDNYNNFIGTIANAGDINNDGLDDILVSGASQGVTPIGVYFGGSSISLNPDDEISFPEDDGTQYGWGIGGVLQGEFDLNGDGIDDFIIGNSQEINMENDVPEGATYTHGGAVHVFYGQDGTPDFSGGSDIRLIADTTAYAENIWYWVFAFNEIADGDFNGDGYTDLAIKPFRHQDQSDINQGRAGIHIFHGGEEFDGQADQFLPLLKEIHQPVNVGVGNDTTAFSGRAEMAAVPDINGDGADELLYMGNSGTRNGSLFFGGDTLSSTPDAVLKAPNQSLGFNTNGNFINRQYRMSIGEMTAEGVTSVLVWQQADWNFRDTPAYMYELSQMAVSNEERVASSIPKTFSLEQNYPNPFNPTTNIQFTIPQASDVKLTVYNILGQQVMTVVNEFRQAGTHTAIVDAQNLSSGMYIYRLDAGSVQLNRKMMLIK
jgi:hypothetical protein|tara:strand:- start:16387 stop:19410 length:3024 start_codon:yes stop_codon:yes gene_type:complete